MKREWHFSLPLGHRIEEKSKRMPMAEAQRLLTTKAANRYTRAQRDGDTATLYSTHLVCPHCRHWVVYNAHTVTVEEGVATYAPRRPRPPKARVQAWADPQITFFDEERATLQLTPSDGQMTAFFCPTCGLKSYTASGYRQVDLSLRRGKISLRCSVESFEEILCLQQMKDRRVHVTFPLYEVLTFHLGRGRVYLRYEDENGALLYCRDVTELPRHMVGGAAYVVLTQSRLVMRRILSLFRQVWGGSLPFTEKMPPVSALVQMTRFVGYPRSFYTAIPYEMGTYRIQSGFRHSAQALHHISALPRLYDIGGLPQAKSLRRLMFATPGFFFYLREVATLNAIFGDVNLICRFLAGHRAFQVLSSLHVCPKIEDYLSAYAHVKSPHRLLTRMEETWTSVYNEAVEYACMSPEMQRLSRYAWRHKDAVSPWKKLPYSIPMHPPAAEIPDCVVDGYTFFWLRSSNDYAHAARMLGNCLSEWTPYSSPVVCVSKGGRYVAAIEVRYPFVAQALGRNNVFLSHDPPLRQAVLAWMERHHLQWSPPDDDLEVLPF